ncbi:hypothetical protein DCAR_0105157 [Daucus carota subsp. sativus]|uniref:Peptidase S1 domain-containing protein n=1 Tax=Daucus carota subsp. sativus TaxID=79200 RepID=A0AAF1AJY3_DAUCS|nr:hypothetical protein DCAR_0105157 [Daucus carota subsp. sativus]
MGVLGETWCFCNGGGKSERMKASIFSGKAPALARIALGGSLFGTGFLIHRNLLLTTHANLPSVSAAESSEIRLQNGVGACLFPHRFFITSSVLDLTIVGLDVMDGDSSVQVPHPQYLKTCSKLNLDLGSVVYILGYAEKNELTVGEGKVVIATDNLIKLTTDGVTWSPGSAGYDVHGNIAFMVCDPMKLATSPNTKSTSTSSSSSSWKRDPLMQFGIPIPIICDWLNQHWEGNLDELTRPKPPVIRLMSAGPKSEQSCASFTKRQVFKSTEDEDNGTPTLSTLKTKDIPGPSSSHVAKAHEEDTPNAESQTVPHLQGIPTPEIYESPKLTSAPFRKNESALIQLLDINFPPRIIKPAVLHQPARKLHSKLGENFVKAIPSRHDVREEHSRDQRHDTVADAEIASTGSVNASGSGVESSSYPVEVSDVPDGYSSEGEITMYSAETAESHNYPSPREVKFQQVGRSQSCVNYSRWGSVQRNPIARRTSLEKQRSFLQGRKVYSQGATSQKSNDYFSPTVSSIMKKRNNLEQQPTRPQQSAVHSSAKWAF